MEEKTESCTTYSEVTAGGSRGRSHNVHVDADLSIGDGSTRDSLLGSKLGGDGKVLLAGLRSTTVKLLGAVSKSSGHGDGGHEASDQH